MALAFRFKSSNAFKVFPHCSEVEQTCGSKLLASGRGPQPRSVRINLSASLFRPPRNFTGKFQGGGQNFRGSRCSATLRRCVTLGRGVTFSRVVTLCRVIILGRTVLSVEVLIFQPCWQKASKRTSLRPTCVRNATSFQTNYLQV